MSSFVFTFPLHQYKIMSSAQDLDNETSIFVRNAGDWVVRGFVVGEPTQINGLLLSQSSTVGTGVSLNGIVGICTSLPPSGLFPHTVNRLQMNNQPGTALTVAFEYTIPVTLNAGGGNTTFVFATNTTNSYTCQPGVQYYAGIYISTVGTAGTVFFRSNMSTNNAQVSNTGNFNAEQAKKSWQRITGTSTTSLTDTEPEFVPYFYDGTNYRYYPITPPQTSTGSINFTDAPMLSGYPGQFFELNDWGIQDLLLRGVQFDMCRWSSNQNRRIFPVLFDGYDTTKVVATGITLLPGDATLGSDPGGDNVSYNYFFAPPVKIRPDYRYFVAIGYTGTVNPNDRLGVAYTHPALSRHNCSAGVKTSLTAPATKITLSGAGIIFCTNLIIESTFPINRAIGN